MGATVVVVAARWQHDPKVEFMCGRKKERRREKCRGNSKGHCGGRLDSRAGNEYYTITSLRTMTWDVRLSPLELGSDGQFQITLKNIKRNHRV